MIKVSNRGVYYFKLVCALAIWSGMYHVARPVAKKFDPCLIAFLRYTIAAVLLLFILKIKTGHINPRLNLRQWLAIISIGTVGIYLYNIFFFNAEALISGNTVAILYAFTPCLSTIISAYVFKTKLNWLCKTGIIIAMLGSIGVINYATPDCGQLFCSSIFHDINRGEIYGILATIVFSCYSVLSKYASQQQISSIVINTYGAVVGCVLLGITSLFHSNFNQINHFDLSFWLVMFYMAVLATVFSYLWYIDAIVHLGVFKTVMFQNTLPLQTVLIGYVIFHEKINLGELVCGTILLAGVYLSNLSINLKNQKNYQIKKTAV